MEGDIQAAQEAAYDAADIDSIMTGTSVNQEDSLMGRYYRKCRGSVTVNFSKAISAN